MRIVIIGAGRVGLRTARITANEGHDVTLVERDYDKAERARKQDFDVIEGDGSSEDVLMEADLDTADALGALAGDLNTNFVGCMVGKYHGCRTVMRIDEDYREEIYEKYDADVDEIIYPERLGAAGAKTALLGGDFNVIADLAEQLTVATVDIPEDAPVVGMRVVEVDLPSQARIYAHGHDTEPMTIPLPRTEIEAGDHVAVLSDPDAITEVRTALRGA